jgi:septal ring-binding cell division protein DamX
VNVALVIGLILLGLVVAGILASIGQQDRYATMSEEEFEAEAQRTSALGGAFLAIQNIVEPQRKVEYLLQRDKHRAAVESASGDGPQPQPPISSP